MFEINWILFAFAVGSLHLTGCTATKSATGGEKAEDTLVWVAHTYSGGRQCGPREPYTPPDTKSTLEQAGIEVVETREQPNLVCKACTCPSYAATHYARIPESHLDLAKKAGFELSDPP